MATDNDFAGGADMEWSRFANGITAKRRQLAYNPDAGHRGDFGDDWANRAFNIRGPNIDTIRDRTHK